MSLTMTASNVLEIERGIWKLNMPPHQVRMFGSPLSSNGVRSVILVRNGQYNSSEQTLAFEAGAVVTLNIGTHAETIAILTEVVSDGEPSLRTLPAEATPFGPGDLEFLSLVRRELDPPMRTAAEKLLEGVRERSSGDLKRGNSRNFSETPDNFWYVIVQPRVQELSVTVRGAHSHFEPMAKLEVKDDRGNTRFKVTSEADVTAALDLIFHAKRKR